MWWPVSVILAPRSWSENPVTGSSPDWATEKFLASVGYRVVTCLKTLDKYQPIEYGHHQDISCRVDSWSSHAPAVYSSKSPYWTPGSSENGQEQTVREMGALKDKRRRK